MAFKYTVRTRQGYNSSRWYYDIVGMNNALLTTSRESFGSSAEADKAGRAKARAIERQLRKDLS